MFQKDWRLVDAFTVQQASWLWCDKDPPKYELGVDDPRVRAIRQMLVGAIAKPCTTC